MIVCVCVFVCVCVCVGGGEGGRERERERERERHTHTHTDRDRDRESVWMLSEIGHVLQRGIFYRLFALRAFPAAGITSARTNLFCSRPSRNVPAERLIAFYIDRKNHTEVSR